ncbi:MAG: hypothetical protein ACRYG8_38815 [Janthinobacterium lividum]
MIRHNLRSLVATRRHGVFAGSSLAALSLAGLMMIVAGSLAIEQTSSPDDVVIQTASSAATGGPADAYPSRVREGMAEWRRRMQTFEARMAASWDKVRL